MVFSKPILMTISRLNIPKVGIIYILLDILLVITFSINLALDLFASPTIPIIQSSEHNPSNNFEQKSKDNLARLKGIEVSYEDNYVLVEINLDAVKNFYYHQLPNPTRWYIDLEDTILDPYLKRGNHSVKGELLTNIRWSQNRPDVTRVVFDLQMVAQPQIETKSNPPQLLLTWGFKPDVAIETPYPKTDSQLTESIRDGETIMAVPTPYSQSGNAEDVTSTTLPETTTAAKETLSKESLSLPIPSETIDTQTAASSLGNEIRSEPMWFQNNTVIILLSIIMGLVIFLIFITIVVFYLMSKNLIVLRKSRLENAEEGSTQDEETPLHKIGS